MVEKCSLCDYARYDYTAAKAVIADYYGIADGKSHTITVSDLSEAGVHTAIRYGNSADSCTMTSAPNYTEAGQYMIYYEITYSYKGKEMTENGVAKVWDNFHVGAKFPGKLYSKTVKGGIILYEGDFVIRKETGL